jgi:PPOX class probable F420-dependent enzyme
MPTIPESHKDLLAEGFATLATVGQDGLPQQTEVWFLAEELSGEEVVRISLNTSRQKTKNLLRDPHCSLLILDIANPYRYLELRGDAEVADDSDYAFADRVGEKYAADLREHDGPGEKRVAVTVRPSRVNAVKMRD